MDPDFLIVLAIAFLVDALDVIFDLLAFLVIPKLIGIFLDFITTFGIGWWMKRKIGKIVSASAKPTSPKRSPLKMVLKRVGIR